MTEVVGADRQRIEGRLAELRVAHNDLDAAIDALSQRGAYDDLQMQRMKRRKLQVRDEIRKLEVLLEPDIIA
ncbi:YdcH family protein [Minwuia thermotolerans]|jgi:hypothetical protein|uniref:DUF465 domain-containing protein n=1 Tax=Minwuia thermotolerans TaxID=2056226 RepID=A0A2M9G757_9PROT|nr:DUF465 domain-containing protein [Minwuia thermotolerans]ANK80199.1 MAG: hypothetical protein TEF_04905 [Rhizobiales bacterium NRL2]PJK31544.1 DUF465 domain-containing protein [Minwuia thermotolerans]